MTHEEIERREIAEEYVRGRLPAEERAAFEDHYFGCATCFAQVRELERFAGGVRAAVEAGELPRVSGARAAWYEPAFYVAAAAALAMGVGLGWNVLRERPRLEAELAEQRESGEAGRRKLAELERKLTAQAVANLPLVMLEASRGEEGAKLMVPPGAAQVALWMEPPPGAAGAVYRLEIRDAAGAMVQVVEGARTNAYGALAMSIPAEGLKAGRFAGRLYRGGALVADYRFEVVR